MKTLIVIGSLVATLALAATAGAGTGKGATVTDSSGCVTTPFATVCSDVHTVTNMTTTPSGNVSYVTNGTSTTQMTFAFGSGCTYTKSEPVHVHWLRKNGELQSESTRLVQATSYSCGGFVLDCTQTIQLHEANGAVQFGRYELVCT